MQSRANLLTADKYKLHSGCILLFKFISMIFCIPSTTVVPYCQKTPVNFALVSLFSFHKSATFKISYEQNYIHYRSIKSVSIEWILYMLPPGSLIFWDSWMTRRAFQVCRTFLILTSTALLHLGSTQYLILYQKRAFWIN